MAHIIVSAVRGAVEREPRAHDEFRGRWGDFHARRPLGEDAVDGETDLLLLGPGYAGHGSDPERPGVPGRYQPGRVYLAVIAAHKPQNPRVGHGLAGGVEGAGRELQRLPDLELAPSRGDLDLDHGRRQCRRSRRLLQQGE